MALGRIVALYLRVGTSRAIVTSSLKISLLVGTALNVINQWDAVSSGAALRIGNLILNYVVPYCVATFGAARALAARECETAEPEAREGCNEVPIR